MENNKINPKGIYNYNGQIATGAELESHRQWLQNYSYRIEAALSVMGLPLKVIGGETYSDGQICFDFNGGFGEMKESIVDTLNRAMIKHGKVCAIAGNKLFVSNMPRRDVTHHILHEMRWVEAEPTKKTQPARTASASPRITHKTPSRQSPAITSTRMSSGETYPQYLQRKWNS